MPVVNVAVGNDMNQFPRLQTGYLGKHVQQNRILTYIPVVGCEHILGTLV